MAEADGTAPPTHQPTKHPIKTKNSLLAGSALCFPRPPSLFSLSKVAKPALPPLSTPSYNYRTKTLETLNGEPNWVYNSKEDRAVYRRDKPTNAVGRAAGLELFRPNQGQERFSETPLDVEVTLGRQTFRDKSGFGFTLAFCRVIVVLLLDRCELSPKMRYERTLPAEDFKQFLKRVVAREKIRKAGAKGSASISLGKIFSYFSLDASASGEIEASLDDNDTKTIESKISFKIVEMLPEGQWGIGHEAIGDPTTDDGLLRSRYLHLPPDNGSEDQGNRLGLIVPEDDAYKSYSVTIELRAKIADCVYIPVGEQGEDEDWAKRNKDQIEGLLATKMLQAQNRRDGLEPDDDEVILSRARLTAKKSE